MDTNRPEFTPEQVDAQIDWLLAHQPSAFPNEQIIDDLQQMYQGDERSLKKVWQHLGLEDHLPVSMGRKQEMLGTMRATQPPASTKVIDMKRKRPMRQAHKHSLNRTISLIAAACFAALIVGSMLFIANLAQQNKNQTGAPAAHLPQGIYASDENNVFRLDPQTHQALWQKALKDVAKIIPSGNVVYILQSNLHNPVTGGTYAVLELDASSGKTLWTHAFAASGHGQIAFARDMVLTQDRLYIGWQTLSGNDAISGAQIRVLKASDGSQLAVYPVTDGVWNMAAGAGVLAVSADGSLQVYDATTNKLLWHVSFHASTNVPVISLKIDSGLIYAVTIAINGESGPNLSSIRAYKATTGEQVWQSPTFASDALSFMTVNQNVVYFGTTLDTQPSIKKPITGRIYAYDVQSNRQLWSTPVNGATLHAPIFNAGLVYMAVDSGVVDNTSPTQAHVIAINATTGTIQWQQTLANTYIDDFCLSNGVIYASSYTITQGGIGSQKLYALKASDGHTQWEYDTQPSVYAIVPTA